MARDIRLGLTAKPKELAPKYFYDERGSQLFEQITELHEYYPTRAEREILARALGRDRRRRGRAGHPGRARLRLGREDAPPAERDARRRLPRHLRPGRHLRGDHPRDRRGAGRGVPGPRRPRPGLRLRARPRAHPQRRRRAPRRLPRRHDRQPLPRRPARLPRPHRRPARARRPDPARHRPGQGAAAASRLAYDDSQRRHRRVQQERPPGAQPRVRRPTSTSTASSTSPATTPRRPAWTSACARSPSRPCGSTAST